jgi:hypothetical protein
LYDEFRVLAVRLAVVPVQQGSVTAANTLGAVVFDNDDSVALTSLVAALEYDTAHLLSAIWYQNNASPTRYTWERPTSGNNTSIPWVDVGTPSGSNGSLKFYFAGLTNSTAYIVYNVEYFVEYRGRR